MWRVVNFEEDNTVDVVPDFWFKNGYCEWPNKTNRMDAKTSIKRRMKPDEIHFTRFKARSLLTNIATFQEPESKAMKAQVTSEFSSNEDEINIATRKRKIIENDKSLKTNSVISQLAKPPTYFEESEPD
ncbi:uncharacterized protein LOC114121933 [Aphis gossypii]|uniref:uncharacterized protein LOC114121933 n=1 Tax=Aphis gossypii TaxID=80765 RepID=UPI002158D3AF|nr:uncharacterized protein LOC114121933 [Aphis gossypii]